MLYAALEWAKHCRDVVQSDKCVRAVAKVLYEWPVPDYWHAQASIPETQGACKGSVSISEEDSAAGLVRASELSSVFSSPPIFVPFTVLL